jgi:PhoH-like ATPase
MVMDTIYVLDTSVLVHDPHALHTFRGANVAIPIFVVMELDELKNSRRYQVASAARLASRMISELSSYGSLHTEEGAYHPELETTFRIIANGGGNGVGALEEAVATRKMDLLILSAAVSMSRQWQDHSVTLVTKDVNLRILADFEGIRAEDYERDRIPKKDLFEGMRRIKDFNPKQLQRAWVPNEALRPEDMGIDPSELSPNEFLVFDEGDRHQLFRYRSSEDALRPVRNEFQGLNDITPRNIEQRMALDLLMDSDIQLVTLVGKAGTGKTYLALAAALAQLNHGHETTPGMYDRILLSKPTVSLGQDIGYLPGDIEAKMEPWMTSFFDNLDLLIRTDESSQRRRGSNQPERGWEHLFSTRQLEIQTLHTIRGRSIPNAFMLIDEAQNLTPHEVKTIITRAADGTKVILAGDPDQVDNPFLDSHSNGLVYVTERLRHSDVVGTVRFTQGERSQLSELAATCL